MKRRTVRDPEKKEVQGTYARIFGVVRRIPAGKVTTYGRIAGLAGFPGQARLTGYALHTLKEGTDVPWYRVVNASGRISFPAGSDAEAIQRSLLEAEGVVFRENGSVDLERVGWKKG
ncbi:MGMT family protein [bacterium]|nr:MGMT family protein [bacterium]